jgi:O-antigen ligase
MVGGVVAWNYMPKAAEAIEKRLSTFQTLEEDKSYLIRQVMIQKGLRLFEESPLIGVGANRFTQTWTDITLPEMLSYRSIEEFEKKNSHNSYIQFLAEFGLIGAIPLALLLVILLVRGSKAAHRSLRKNNMVPLAFFVSFIQMSVHMWVITALTGTVTWFIYGMVTAIIKRETFQSWKDKQATLGTKFSVEKKNEAQV